MQEGLPAKIKGTPIRLNLKLPEAQSLLQRPRAPTPVLHPASPRISADQPSPAPTQTFAPASSPQRSHAHQPSPLAQSHTAASLGDVDSSAAHGSAGLFRSLSQIPWKLINCSELAEEEVDSEQTVMWTHSFQIEARTTRGTPRKTGGDVFAVAITGSKVSEVRSGKRDGKV